MTRGAHVVVAGGGTGGHLFPGVAVIEAMEKLDPAVRVSFVGSSRGIEARVVPELGYPFRQIEVHPLKNGGVGGFLKGAASLPLSGLQAIGHVRSLRPDLVVAVGGYAAGPFTAAAATMGIPTALMEQNATLGLTNKLLSRLVDRAFVAFPKTCQAIPDKVTCEALGNPIRGNLVEMGRDFAYQAPSADGTFQVLVIGGSGGARSLNLGIPTVLAQLPRELRDRLRVTHQAGRGRADSAREAYAKFDGNWRVTEFIDDMAQAYADCDLLICRAGMSTIAEVTVLGIPALYVPFPSSDGHQESNALEVVEAGAGMMVSDAELTNERTTRLVAGLMRNPESLANLAARAKTLGRPDAARDVAQRLLEMV